MSEKPGSKKSVPPKSKTDLPTSKPGKEDSEKVDKTVPKKTKTKTDSKKDLDAVPKDTNEKSKAKIDKKPSIDQKKPAAEENNPGADDKKPANSNSEINVKEQPKEDGLTSDMKSVFKSITDEFNSVSAHFQGLLKEITENMGNNEAVKRQLNENHTFYRSHEQLATVALSQVKRTFQQINEVFSNYEETTKRQLGSKTNLRDYSTENEAFSKRVKEVQKQIVSAFKEKSADEAKKAQSSYEIVTVASLDADAKHRLLSANINKNDLGSMLENSHGKKGAADEGKSVKRQVAADLYDKTFVGHKSFGDAQSIRRHYVSKEVRQFKQYESTFDLKPIPDINLKGMGKLNLIRLYLYSNSFYG